MKTIPQNWHLVEEWNNNFIFESKDSSFRVDVDFTEPCIFPYFIGFVQLKGIFVVIGTENSANSANASEGDEALEKAVVMMLFIDKITRD